MNKESVIKYLRGLIIASKFPITLRQLDFEFTTILGQHIPYQTLGYKSLEEFLRCAETLQVSPGGNGDLVVKAQKVAQSSHIVEMVQRQKPPKKPLPKRNHYAAATRNWRPKYSPKSSKTYAKSSRLDAVSHNQFVDYQKPKVSSKVVIPEHSTYRRNIPPRLQKQGSVTSRLQINATHSTNQVAKELNENADFVKSTIRDVLRSVSEDSNCSPGSSRRKKITKMMSEINLDRDSGNSSPVSDNGGTVTPLLPAKVPDFVSCGNVKLDLKNFAEYHKLGEINVSLNKVSGKRIKMYTCKIKVGNHIFTSYPEEFSDPESAELYCYKEAFKELSLKYGKRKSLFLSSDKDIIERIPKMLEKHAGGLWEWQVQMDYAEKYNEQLPQDWLKIVDTSSCVHVQKVVNGYTLKHCRPEEVLQKGQMWFKSMTLTDVSVPCNTVEFKEDGKLFAEVTFLISANEVWCRQTDTFESDKYVQMINDMETFYNTNKINATAINRNGYYVAENNGDWYRVKAVEVTDTSVLCFYIDFGHEVTLPKENVYQMKREFAICQAQAFVCRLVGLEDLYDSSNGSTSLQTYLYKQVVLEMAADVALEENILPVYLYDFETGSSINQELMSTLTIESATPIIDAIAEVNVSNIANNGDIYVQIQSHGFMKLQQLLFELESQIINNPPTDILESVNQINSKDRVYLGKYNPEGHWYRLKILDWSPKGDLAQIYYIDYGNTDVIIVKETVLYPLDKLNEIVNLYPPQAVKTRMLLDKTPEDFLSVAEKIIPTDTPVIIKVVDHNKDNIPLAEFFSRTTDGGLFCINKSIMLKNEMKKWDQPKTIRKILTAEGTNKNVPSGGKLSCPPLPDVNRTFEVHIPFAVHPYNFFVQPLETHPKLNKMMEKLQERYKDVLYSPLTLEQIIPGNIYASQYEDGNWYRTSVIKVINKGSITVFYCDFGYYANLTVEKLIPLDRDFLELPYQALKAKLSGIKPKLSNWTMQDCEEFRQMVERKNFYSVLLAVEKDELYESDLLLHLMLIDTSSPEDIYIETELINRDIAVAT